MQSKLDNVRKIALDLLDKHRLAVGVTLVIVTALLLTFLNMWLYVQSGAAGLDLSRPGFSEARDNVRVVDASPEFSAEGLLSKEIVDDYLRVYRQEVDQANQLGVFGPEPLSDKVLRFDVTETN